MDYVVGLVLGLVLGVMVGMWLERHRLQLVMAAAGAKSAWRYGGGEQWVEPSNGKEPAHEIKR